MVSRAIQRATPRFETELTQQGTHVTMTFEDEILSQATAQNQKIARQLCAKQYYELEIVKAKQKQKEDAKNRISGSYWQKDPYSALQEYCRKKGIYMDFENDFNGGFKLTVGDDDYYCFEEDGFKRGTKPHDRAKKRLAKIYYEMNIKPLIKKQKEQEDYLIVDRQQKNAKNPNALHKINLSDPENEDFFVYEYCQNKASLLDKFCQKSNLPKPIWTSEQNGSSTTVFLEMPGIEDIITIKSKTLYDAKENASLICLTLIDLMQQRKLASEDGPAYQDKVDYLTSRIDSIKKECFVSKKTSSKQEAKSPPSDVALAALKARFNSSKH